MRTFPIPADHAYSYAQRFGEHRGTDIMAADGVPVVAVDDGVAVAANESKGGLVVYLTSPTARYYYAHLSAVQAPLDSDDRQTIVPVTAGQVLGYVGSTGNAVGRPPHLHFMVDLGSGWQDPYPLLRSVDPRSQPTKRPFVPLVVVALALLGGALLWGANR